MVYANDNKKKRRKSERKKLSSSLTWKHWWTFYYHIQVRVQWSECQDAMKSKTGKKTLVLNLIVFMVKCSRLYNEVACLIYQASQPNLTFHIFPMNILILIIKTQQKKLRLPWRLVSVHIIFNLIETSGQVKVSSFFVQLIIIIIINIII